MGPHARIYLLGSLRVVCTFAAPNARLDRYISSCINVLIYVSLCCYLLDGIRVRIFQGVLCHLESCIRMYQLGNGLIWSMLLCRFDTVELSTNKEHSYSLS